MSMNKKGNALLWTILVAVLAGVGILGFMAFSGDDAPTPVPRGTTGGQQVSGVSCPDDLDWAGTFSVRNALNSTGNEEYDTTAYFYDISDGSESFTTSITDTTSGDVTLQCGKTYRVKIQSVNGAGGDSSQIQSTSEGNVVDGHLEFTPSGSGNRVTVDMNQFGAFQVKARDEVNDGFLFDNQDGSATDYETADGVVFNGTTAGDSGIAVGDSGNFESTLFVQSTSSDNDANDRGIYVLIDSSTSVWDTDNAVVKIDGSVANEVSGELSDDERIAYNDYELVYKVPGDRLVKTTNDLEINLNMNALGGQDPTGAHNISMDLAPIGQFLSTETSNLLKVGSVDDTSSRSDVYTRFDTVYWIS